MSDLAGGRSSGEPARGVADEILAGVRADGLLAGGRQVLVMLSGGRDSTCLLDVAVRVAGAVAVAALHVNYGLRDAARGDEEHCRELCERLAVELTVTRPNTPTLGNLQAWARDVRYGAAAQLALTRGGDVAAGHTATDQVETILYRLASSPSRRALLGMRPRDGILVRPLLGFTREQTGAYCLERGLAWRDDESNATDAYARGRVRHGLVPALREIHPGAEQNVLALAATLRDEAEVLDALVDAELAGGAQIELERLRELPAALARLVVQRLADQAGGGPTPGTARRLPDILELRETGAAHVDLPGGIRATVLDGVLGFARTPARETPDRGTPDRGTPARGTPARETPARGTPARETPAREDP
ncbi:MAG: tRNA lysidine(34) synthetase TilS [Conexibacteraceae bacterium]|nr:tRNA lysidine(34) synthetase TilS [Conexibacteraceae bacterium]